MYRNYPRYFLRLMLVLAALMLSASCSSRRYTLAPVKTFDPDNRNIPAPRVLEENQIWDLIDYTGVYQLEKPLDLNWTGERLGKFLGLTGGRPADNVNALDEVPNSSWYTNRHYHHRLSPAELARGPNTTSGPDLGGPLTITRGKFEGGTPGFFVKDVQGDRYILKFDALKYYEMGSSAEVISTKILYAAGYYVPENSIVYIDPHMLRIGEGVKILDQGVKRRMNRQDLEEMLRKTPRTPEGKIRVLASKFVDGRPVGVWNYRGLRKDDPNDRVYHEHRRELRGLRVIASWLNDADRRAANTLAVYTEEEGRKYIKHYIIDMGSTLGSNNKFPHAPKYGNEYLVDPRSILRSFLSLGLWVKPWEFETAHLNPKYPSVGYFESEIFNPGSWVPTYPNPAFERATLRDAFWGAKIVMSFRDEDIRAIVKTAVMSDPEAEAYLIRTLIERRDKIGRYWFARIAPLDRFRIRQSAAKAIELTFSDLAVEYGLESAGERRYHYRLFHRKRPIGAAGVTKQPVIALSRPGPPTPLQNYLAEARINSEEDKIFRAELRIEQAGQLSKKVAVYFYFPGPDRPGRVAGIEREE